MPAGFGYRFRPATMKPVSAAKNRPVCAAAAKRSSQLAASGSDSRPCSWARLRVPANSCWEEGPTHQHRMGRDADLAQAGLLEHARQPAANASIAQAVRHQVENPPGQRWVGMVDEQSVPVEIEDDDLPARPGHPDHLSERLFGRLQMHEGPLRAAAIERFVGQIQPLRVAQAVLQ
jgi:hypothetical protein